jgi:hypothetical protein
MNNPESSSKVSERLLWLSGKQVSVRLSYVELGQINSEEFVATYRDTLPMGRAYFFVFEVGGRNRLVRTENVIDMTEN